VFCLGNDVGNDLGNAGGDDLRGAPTIGRAFLRLVGFAADDPEESVLSFCCVTSEEGGLEVFNEGLASISFCFIVLAGFAWVSTLLDSMDDALAGASTRFSVFVGGLTESFKLSLGLLAFSFSRGTSGATGGV